MKYLQKIVLIISFVLPLSVLSQAPSFTDDTEDTPIDGGLSVLVAAGVGYGMKKLKHKNNSKRKL